MKERPILFNGPMVRAILDGRKTQTRRIIKPQPADDTVGSGHWYWKTNSFDSHSWPDGFLKLSTYGVTGDRLWVKETWKPHCDCDADGSVSEDHPLGTCVKYKADGAMIKPDRWREDEGFWCESQEDTPQWRPSIFMPWWASRITLEITGVRVEKVQEISEEDAKAEGVEPLGESLDFNNSDLNKIYESSRWRGAYQIFWDSINGKKHPWVSNPWVWCISFRRL